LRKEKELEKKRK